MAEKLAQDVAELSGIIKGLTEVVKQQATNQNTTSKHIDDLAKQIKDVSEGSTPHQPNPGHGQQSLRLPQVQLLKFEGKISDDLDRFIEQFNSLIKSSSVSSRFWVTFLKQQVQTDQRAFDIVAKAEIDCKTSSLGHDPTKASEADFSKFYEKVCEILVIKRGVPSDQRIRQLLHEYYSMVQNPGEKVSEFSHRFLDV